MEMVSLVQLVLRAVGQFESSRFFEIAVYVSFFFPGRLTSRARLVAEGILSREM
jgi:hypothetical protein